MRTNNLSELVKVVEEMRAKLHPDLDAAFLEAVIRAEDDNPEAEADSIRDIQVALKAAIDLSGHP